MSSSPNTKDLIEEFIKWYDKVARMGISDHSVALWWLSHFSSTLQDIKREVGEMRPILNNIPASHRKTALYVANTTKDQIVSILTKYSE